MACQSSTRRMASSMRLAVWSAIRLAVAPESACDAETRRFNVEAANLPGDVQILSVSMDLPFAQARWCGAAGVDKVTMISDFKDPHDFGNKYGVMIKELGLLARAVFVIDKNDNVTHAEYVKEVASHPDYEATLAAAKKAAAA